MAEVSAISWTDATFNPCLRDERVTPKLGLMCQLMAPNAESDTIPNVEPQIRKLGKWADVVSVQVAALVVAAMAAGEFIAKKYTVPPLLQLGRQSLASALDALSIDISWRVLTPWRPLARSDADLSARLQGVLLPGSIAWPCQSRGAHFGAALV